jgi:hypothetical protein
MSSASRRRICVQLALPLPESPRQAPLAPAACSIAPAQVWATLDLGLQTDLHQALLRVLQEVLHDAPRH